MGEITKKQISKQVVSMMKAFRDKDGRLISYHARREDLNIMGLYLVSIRKENTRRAYFRDLVLFFSFCKNVKKVTLKKVTSYDLDDFVEILLRGEVSGRKLKASSISRVLAAISSFYQFLYKRKLVLDNPVSLVKRPRKTRPLMKTFSRGSLEWILENIPEDALGSQHRAIFLLCASTGARIGEIISLKNRDFNSRRGEITYISQKSEIELNKRLTPMVVEAILLHREKREEILKANGLDLMRDDEDPLISAYDCLWPPKPGKPERNRFINRNSVNKFIKMWFERAKEAGFSDVPDKVTSHSFRRYFATSALQARDKSGSRMFDLAEVAKLLGHSGLSAISAYDNRETDSKSVAESLGF